MAKSEEGKERQNPPDQAEVQRRLGLMNQAVAAVEEFGYTQPNPQWYRLDTIFTTNYNWLREHNVHPLYDQNKKRWTLR